MNIQLSSFLSVAFFAVGSIFSSVSVLAQVTTDGTTSTTVTPTDTGVQIDSGNRNGGNLFHSFDEFSVPTKTEAFFNNADDIVNIFSRVTGGNISNIDGTLRANGTANLFLINPAGIVFGENARLQLGGSFYGSTADSIIFPDGKFSATDLENPPLITVNAPIGLGFRDNPAEIVNQSTADDLGLQLSSGNTFALVGGDIRFTGGLVSAPGSNIELGGLIEAGIVTINEDGSLSFSEELAKANITLDDASVVNAIGNGGGSITVNANNLELLRDSDLLAGIAAGTESLAAQAGDITINVTEKITLDSRDTDLETSIQNIAGDISEDFAIDLSTKGSPGNIIINTKILEGKGNFAILSANNGEGNVGNVNIVATESISLRGQAEFFPGFGSAVGLSGIGDGGDVTVTTPSLTILDANIITSTLGRGNAGDLTLNISGSLTIDGDSQLQALSIGGGNSGNIIINSENADISLTGEDLIITTTVVSLETQFASFPEFFDVLENFGFSSTLGSQGGDIIINARNLSADNDVQIATSTVAQASREQLANAGDIEINVAENLSLSNSSQLVSDSAGQGNAGKITLNVGNAISLAETSVISTGIQQKSGDLAEGFTQSVRGGDITITSNSLSLTEGSIINASTFDRGDAGQINLNIKENISLSNFSILRTDTNGQGNAGDISIDAGNDITLNQTSIINTAIVERSGDLAADFNQSIRGGDIVITSKSLSIVESSFINASTSDRGDAGNISITTRENILIDSKTSSFSGIFTGVNADAIGNGGEIKIQAKNLTINGSGGITASTLGRGNTGSISVTAEDNISLDGEMSERSGIVSLVGIDALGNGDEIKITATNLAIRNGATIDASTFSRGNAGNIAIATRENLSLDGTAHNMNQASSIVSVVNLNAIGNAGEINIATNNLSITAGAFVSSSTLGQGDVGQIAIAADDKIVIDGKTSDDSLLTGISNDIGVDAIGNSSNIKISTGNITVANQGFISTSNLGQGNGGNIELFANMLNLDRGGLLAINQPPETNNTIDTTVGGNLNLEVSDSITLRNNSFISAQAGANASGGNININTDLIIAFPSRFDDSDIRADAEQGRGGRINITAESVLGIAERTLNPLTNDINASSQVAGLEGTISINTPDLNPLRAKSELPNNPISNNIVAANTCEIATTKETSNLIVKGKGSIRPEIINPLMADNLIIIDEQSTASNFTNIDPSAKNSGNNIQISSKIEPAINTEETGEVYAARGIVREKDGTVYLTAYQTSEKARPLSNKLFDCNF